MGRNSCAPALLPAEPETWALRPDLGTEPIVTTEPRVQSEIVRTAMGQNS